ncbi:MAG: tetratricopeptide repeat protein [Planctomycetia bacterium]|nr:tetratricopeptide repeat protein [Planctomycetia bacterium]
MRKFARLGVMLLTASATGCASHLGTTAPPPTGASAVMPAQQSTASSGGVTGFVGSVAGGMKQGTEKMVSWVTPTPKPAQEDDPTSLSSTMGKVTPELHITMAEMQEKSGNPVDAKKHYEMALKQSPHHMGALLGMGHLLDRQGKMTEAAEKYQMACKFHPKEARPYNDLGLCYFRQHKLPEAAKSLTKAVDLDPQKVLYRNNLATVLTEMGRTDDALKQLAAVHGEAKAHYNLGYLLYQKGNRPEAAKQFAAAAQADPSLVAARRWSEQLAAAPASADRAQVSAPQSEPELPPPPAALAMNLQGAASRPAPAPPAWNVAPVVTNVVPMVNNSAAFLPAPPARKPAPPVATVPSGTARNVIAPNVTVPEIAAAPVQAPTPTESFYRNELRASSGGLGSSPNVATPVDYREPHVATLPRPLPPIEAGDAAPSRTQ